MQRVVYVVTSVLTIISLLWFSVLMNEILVLNPVTAYASFVIWCTLLSVWSYRKLQSKWITIQDTSGEDDWPKGLRRLEDPEYQALRTRHAFYFMGMALTWFVVFMGEPGPDEYGEWLCNSVMAIIALKHFGFRSDFEGFAEFDYLSTGHAASFYLLSLVPLLILAVGGSLVYQMSQSRRSDAIAEHEKTLNPMDS